MKKTEVIWREILEEAFRERGREFQQQELAKKLGVSVSTVFNALKLPRKAKGVRVTGNGFTVREPEKLLYLWASLRNIERDILYQTRVDEGPRQVEGKVPPGIIFGAYSAYRLGIGTPPADYDTIYLYGREADTLRKRFPPEKGRPNLFLLKADPWLARFGSVTPLSQTFIDLWNLPEWYAKDFLKGVKERIDALLA